MKNIKNGFTIIELIVVIAIIGTLSAIVMVNVVNYINKSKDAKIISNLTQIAKNAQILFSENGNYIDASNLDLPSEIYTLKKNETAFVAYAPISSGFYWCVDSNNASKQILATPNDEVYECVAGSGGSGDSSGPCNNDGACNDSKGEDCSNCSNDCGCERYGHGYTCHGTQCAYGTLCPSGQICQPYSSCCGTGCCYSMGDSCCDDSNCFNPTLSYCCGYGDGKTCNLGETCCGNTCCQQGYYCANESTGECAIY